MTESSGATAAANTRSEQATPPGQSIELRQSAKQYESPEPSSGTRQMLPAAQLSYCLSVPASETVHALPGSRSPAAEQTVLPSPARVHFWEHQSQLPVWHTESQGAPAAILGTQAFTLGAPQDDVPPVSGGRLEASASTGENSALAHAADSVESTRMKAADGSRMGSRRRSVYGADPHQATSGLLARTDDAAP